jgi:hypothetical protein
MSRPQRWSRHADWYHELAPSEPPAEKASLLAMVKNHDLTFPGLRQKNLWLISVPCPRRSPSDTGGVQVCSGLGLRPHSLAEQRFFSNGRIIVRGSTGTRRQGKRADDLLRYSRDAAAPGIHFSRAKGPALSQPRASPWE